MLTESVNPANYWKVLKNRLKKEGNETVTNCNQLKLRAADGKMRMTDVATAEQMFRVIQSIPSLKAEPFKMWMAKVARNGSTRCRIRNFPFSRLTDYRRLGYTEKWIARRLKSIDIRKDLTDEWKACYQGLREFLLTNITMLNELKVVDAGIASPKNKVETEMLKQ